MHDIKVKNGVDVASIHYNVRTDKKHDNELMDRNHYGECHNRTGELYVASQYGADLYNLSFIHELIEAIDSRFCQDNVSHDHICGLSEGLAQAFKSLGVRFVYK